ncbi:hypothetical protein C1752_09156 [Acaryochloris thomasi RCC1774]|uniref:Uncharacterized protein n=1 Tax=Acaryochloris thomasi RCC1774 TaxID=1764569 RepID=A0A2W1JI85_9CYAN|nr:hypothetical protein [Acaryochloris thomasi]PZD70792.1 hypothetical protein C1752_09156 [Acaryochloris thomasi RCC1774]
MQDANNHVQNPLAKLISYSQANAAGIAVLLAVLGGAWGILASTFSFAVERTVDPRFEALEQQLNENHLELKSTLAGISNRLEALEKKP